MHTPGLHTFLKCIRLACMVGCKVPDIRVVTSREKPLCPAWQVMLSCILLLCSWDMHCHTNNLHGLNTHLLLTVYLFLQVYYLSLLCINQWFLSTWPQKPISGLFDLACNSLFTFFTYNIWVYCAVINNL